MSKRYRKAAGQLVATAVTVASCAALWAVITLHGTGGDGTGGGGAVVVGVAAGPAQRGAPVAQAPSASTTPRPR